MLFRCPLAARGAGMIATRRAPALAICPSIQTQTTQQTLLPQSPPAQSWRGFNTSTSTRAKAVENSTDDAPTINRNKATGQSSDRIPATYKWPITVYPTPYEIFNISDTGSNYSKTLFYELVKLYHPDRCTISSPHIHSHHVQNLHHDHMLLSDKLRLERFRMIVLANEILSDPRKRERYDRYGLGWIHTPAARGARADDTPYARGARKGYGDGSKWDASQNATWEDWERYYERTSGVDQGTQKPLYMSNMTFVALVTAACGLGGYLNLTYATGVSQGIIDEIDKQTAELADELERKRREALAHGSKEERIKAFLQLRDPIGYSLDSKGLNKPETCLGDLGEEVSVDQKGYSDDRPGGRGD